MGLYSFTNKFGKRVLQHFRHNPNTQKRYPFSSTKQHEKCAARQRNVIVNGFQIMQTLPTALHKIFY